jgi:hypothetical protein
MSRPRHGCAVVFGLFLSLAGLLAVSPVISPAVAHAQSSFTGQNPVRSLSGQFMVSSADDGAPLFHNLSTMAGTNLVWLDPALLAVAAERFKISLRQQLGLPPDASWSGRIFLVLHPARSTDEAVTIASEPFLNHWDYRVEFPDVLTRPRYARALSAVLLLELANRRTAADGHSAEIPAWLVDGTARQVLAADGEKVVLSAPVNRAGGLPVGRLDQTDHDFDAFAGARRILQNQPALTFDQLSWPADAQLAGADGGAYYASAQLFLHNLLELKNGPAKLRNLIAELPDHLNWQTSFYDAFREDFTRPLDVEKWWALRVVNFAARAPGPRWTTAVSRDRLEELLSVPVEFRNDAGALPEHGELSLQAAIRNLTPDQRDTVLRTKVRDLALVELRLAPPFGGLADAYRSTLAEFLDWQKTPAPGSVSSKHPLPRPGIGETLKKLDVLDSRWRQATAQSVIPLPGNSGVLAP